MSAEELIGITGESAFLLKKIFPALVHRNLHRVKKGVSVFRKGSGKSNLNVSGAFPQGGYDVKREREK